MEHDRKAAKLTLGSLSSQTHCERRSRIGKIGRRGSKYLSIAQIAAQLQLPLGVVLFLTLRRLLELLDVFSGAEGSFEDRIVNISKRTIGLLSFAVEAVGLDFGC